MKITGSRKSGSPVILVDGQPLDPAPSQRLKNHSPDGFEYGYAGSGPSQLALALMLALGVDEETALDRYQELKRIAIAILPDDFTLDLEFTKDGHFLYTITDND